MTIIEKARKEAIIYKKAGIDAVMIENMHDTPYLNKSVGPEITTSITAIACAVRKELAGIPCGLQILAGANKEALAAAHASGLDFIRAEGFVFAHVADEGIIESCAGELLRYRKQIGAENILVLADIKKKHSSHSITNDVSISETAHAAEFFLSDGVIVTGTATGLEADLDEVKGVKKSVAIPVLVGSGVTLDNLENYLTSADALIVGSYFKNGGIWTNPIDSLKVKNFMKKAKAIRQSIK